MRLSTLIEVLQVAAADDPNSDVVIAVPVDHLARVSVTELFTEDPTIGGRVAVASVRRFARIGENDERYAIFVTEA